MGRNSRKRSKESYSAHVRAVSQPDMTPSAAYGSFAGAMPSQDRGYVFVPTLDSRKEVDEWSRLELMARTRFVYASGGGLVHRGINGIARMVTGMGLMPHPMAKKKDWNRRLRKLWLQRCGSANTFDLSRKYNAYNVQPAIVRSKIKDGDVAGVLARNEDNRLRCMLYESNQIGMGRSQRTTPSPWNDGVLTDVHGAPLAYRILGETNGKETTTDIPSQNVLFCANAERINQVRGLTKFYPVINKVLDRAEIMSAFTGGIKNSANIAYVIEQELQKQTQVQAGGLGSLTPRATRFVETNDGKKITLESLLKGNEAWGLQPGQSFKVVQSQNPHPNVQDYLYELVREIAYALDVSPEILWNIIELGGANIRFAMADLQSFIELEQEALVDQFLGPWYIAWVMDMIESDEIEDPGSDWYVHTWISPARMTVDFGRDDRVFIERYKRGMITMKSLYGFRGEEWELEIDQYLDERQYIKDGLKTRDLTWEEGFPELRQSPIDQQAEATARAIQDKADEKEKEKKS